MRERERERERESNSFTFHLTNQTKLLFHHQVIDSSNTFVPKKKKKEPSLFIYIIYFFLGRGLSGLTHLFEPSKRLAVGKKNRYAENETIYMCVCVREREKKRLGSSHI